MLPHPLVFLAVLGCSVLVGQTPAGDAAKPPGPKDTLMEKRSQAMREQITAGRQVNSHVRVAVRLKNGNRLTGVVKDGKLVERVDGLRFVEAQAREAGAGVRLWYAGSGRNYVFVPFADFAEYEVLQRLTGKQLADLEREMQQDEKHSTPVTTKSDAEVADPVAKETAGDGVDKPASPAAEGAQVATKSPKPTSAGDPAAAADAALAEQRQWVALLQDYPPKDGWNKAKRDEIARRFVVVGAKPSASEQRFVDEFAAWEKACAHFIVDPKAAGSGEPVEPIDPGKGKSKSRGSKPAAAPTTTEDPSSEAVPVGSKEKRRRQ